MPYAAPRPCPTCGAVNCQKHKRKHGWQHTKTSTQRGYGYKWQKIRERILRRDDGLCQSCLRAGKVEPATQVDHIVPKSQGGTDDESNLEAICSRCNLRKAQREANGKSGTGAAR